MEKKKEEAGRYGTWDNLWYWLKKLYGESPGFVWLYLAEMVLSVSISLVGVYMPSVLVADITRGEGLEAVLLHLGLLGGGFLILQTASIWMEGTKTILENRICFKQGLQVACRCVEADYSCIERSDFPGEFWQLINRHRWTGEYTSRFMEAFVALGTAVVGMVLYTGMLSGLSLWILLLVTGATAVNYAVGIRCNKWDAANHHKWHDLDNKMFYLSRSTSSYEASKDVHLYHMPPWLRKLFDRELKARLQCTVRQQANYYLEGAVGGFTQMIWEGAAYLYLIYMVCQGEIDAAGFVFYFGVIPGFASWCNSVASGMRGLHQKGIFVGEERRFLERLKKEENDPREELVLAPGHIPEVTFENVTFSYQGASEPVLKNVSLTLRPGENLALVGLNGAGKTTFVKLLCGFYEPVEGRILVDGVDRRRYSSQSWLKYFSGVFQDAGLFPLSLEENLALGGTSRKGKMEECLRLAGLAEKMQKLPQGLRTMCGVGSQEEAVDFSGGELQKLMLARALYKEAPLLVLDEPTAALDPLMESELYERYRQFSQGRTTVFISHRLASTRFCDRILLMEEGQVAEAGTHEELMERDKRYAWMFRLQARYYQKMEAQKEAGLEGEEVRE